MSVCVWIENANQSEEKTKNNNKLQCININYRNMPVFSVHQQQEQSCEIKSIPTTTTTTSTTVTANTTHDSNSALKWNEWNDRLTYEKVFRKRIQQQQNINIHTNTLKQIKKQTNVVWSRWKPKQKSTIANRFIRRYNETSSSTTSSSSSSSSFESNNNREVCLQIR